MKRAQLDDALSALSGKTCTHSAAVVNRKRFLLSIVACVPLGIFLGVVIPQYSIGIVLGLVALAISEPLWDRRVVGLADKELVQAKSARFVPRPTELLPSKPVADVVVLKITSSKTADFRIDNATYTGSRGSGELAEVLKRRQP